MNKAYHFNPAPEDAAFPNPETESRSGETGLTKREYFAAMALQGFLASWGNHDLTDFEDLASDAVGAADALIAELNKPAQP